MDLKVMPHETDRLIGNGSMGRCAVATVSFDVIFNVEHSQHLSYFPTVVIIVTLQTRWTLP